MVDLPGYGWAQVSKTAKAKWKKMIHAYLLNRQNLMLVFVLVDCRLDPQKIDLEFIQWVGLNKIPIAIVFTKSDKISANQLQSSIAKYKKVLKKEWTELPPIFHTSALKKKGEEIVNYIYELNSTLEN